jgi:hypothetical protein
MTLIWGSYRWPKDGSPIISLTLRGVGSFSRGHLFCSAAAEKLQDFLSFHPSVVCFFSYISVAVTILRICLHQIHFTFRR